MKTESIEIPANKRKLVKINLSLIVQIYISILLLFLFLDTQHAPPGFSATRIFSFAGFFIFLLCTFLLFLYGKQYLKKGPGLVLSADGIIEKVVLPQLDLFQVMMGLPLKKSENLQ